MSDIEKIIAKLNKDAGIDVAVSGDTTEEVDVIPTGIQKLDMALGVGGFPRGRITDIYGLPSVGKSTICYTAIAEAQRHGITCALIDAENSFTQDFPQKLGVDLSKLIVINPPSLEHAGDAIESLIESGVGLIVVDSTATLVPRALAEAGMDKAPMAAQARGISQMLLKLVHPLKKHNTALVFISQMRVNMMAFGLADKYVQSGGYALKFYSTIRIEMKRLKAIMKGSEHIGYTVKFTAKKNKLSKPGIDCEVEYYFDGGFSREGDYIEMGLKSGVVEQQGAWFIVNGEKYHGKEKAALAIESDPSLREKIIDSLR